MEWANQSIVTEFITAGFPSLKKIRVPVFLLVLLMYTVTMLGNMVIIFLTRTDPSLCTPMYYFLGNFSFLEIWYTSVTVPRMLADLLVERKVISFNSCISQLYFFLALGAAECLLLAVMAYDRYLAICCPLRYTALMSGTVCIQLTTWTWITSFLLPLVPVILISQLRFCGPNVVDHFFCDILPVLRLACANTRLNEMLSFFLCSSVILGSFVLTMASYGSIITTILGIPSAAGRKKAFSTCASHLTVVAVFYGTVTFMYARPTRKFSFQLDKVVAVFYCVVTPLLNPIIYSLRNQEVKEALRKALCGKGRALK
ncbi:olfactory receptor 6N1-like [Gopherus flavomarginatus]|uniref:olfactory receptor 6N1-like n=1 Tax=Gopherus flavomarginatus TaxID=286002 RepID=UPI0021CBB5EE|nr:olfactory receptor 6N1-like [Gopherus flavomarginatus]XP_050773926.1 olfactory receptor 6N1-like [Gopherus flavomarginatus]